MEKESRLREIDEQDLEALLRIAEKYKQEKSAAKETQEENPAISALPEAAKANPVKYLLGDTLRRVREAMVQNPEDPTYQVARKLASKGNGDSETDEMIGEVMTLGVYKVLNDLVNSDESFMTKLYNTVYKFMKK